MPPPASSRDAAAGLSPRRPQFPRTAPVETGSPHAASNESVSPQAAAEPGIPTRRRRAWNPRSVVPGIPACRGALDSHAPPPTLAPPLAAAPLRPPSTIWPRTYKRRHRLSPNHRLRTTPLDTGDPRHTNLPDQRCPNRSSAHRRNPPAPGPSERRCIPNLQHH
ncbi:hypothetical protein ACQJBY_068463 [Aegilops geniculata]